MLNIIYLWIYNLCCIRFCSGEETRYRNLTMEVQQYRFHRNFFFALEVGCCSESTGLRWDSSSRTQSRICCCIHLHCKCCRHRTALLSRFRKLRFHSLEQKYQDNSWIFGPQKRSTSSPSRLRSLCIPPGFRYRTALSNQSSKKEARKFHYRKLAVIWCTSISLRAPLCRCSQAQLDKSYCSHRCSRSSHHRILLLSKWFRYYRQGSFLSKYSTCTQTQHQPCNQHCSLIGFCYHTITHIPISHSHTENIVKFSQELKHIWILNQPCNWLSSLSNCHYRILPHCQLLCLHK